MELANIQTDSETLEKLRELAKVNERSMSGQLRWMINREWSQTFTPLAEVNPTEAANGTH